MRLAEQMMRHHEMFVDALRMADACEIKAFASDTKTMTLEVVDLKLSHERELFMGDKRLSERPTMCLLALISMRGGR